MTNPALLRSNNGAHFRRVLGRGRRRRRGKVKPSFLQSNSPLLLPLIPPPNPSSLPAAEPAMHKQNILFLLSSLNKDFFISFPEWRIGEGEGVAEGRAHHTLPTTLSAPSFFLSFGGASSLSGSKDSKSALKE